MVGGTLMEIRAYNLDTILVYFIQEFESASYLQEEVALAKAICKYIANMEEIILIDKPF